MKRSKWFTALKNALFPPSCAFCGRPCGPSCYCGSCELPFLPQSAEVFTELAGIDAGFAPFWYRGGVRKAILDLKRNRIRDNHLPLARFMCDALRQNGFSGADVVTCVPIGKSSLFEREYNQSELLARYLARDFGITYTDTLVRSDDGTHQKELSAQQRFENIAGKFSPIADLDLHRKHVLLVDDVCTTGATLQECTRVLRRMGACRVTVCCAAVTPKEDGGIRL